MGIQNTFLPEQLLSEGMSSWKTADIDGGVDNEAEELEMVWGKVG